MLDLRREGTTIVFSTHDMAAAEKLCDRIFMIFKGHKVLDGTLDEIQSQYGQDTVRVRTRRRRGRARRPAGDRVGRTTIGNFQDVRLQRRPAGLSRSARRSGRRSTHFEMTKPSLHDIFVRIARPTAEECKRRQEPHS